MRAHLRVVFDTNVVVSAMLTGGGTPDLALQLVLQGDAILLTDSRIMAEYDEVTSRPRFGFPPIERRVLLDVLARLSQPVLSRPLRLSLPDPDDRLVVEVAIAGGADAIVTGNTRYFVPKKGELGVTVWTPRQFVDRLRR